MSFIFCSFVVSKESKTMQKNILLKSYSLTKDDKFVLNVWANAMVIEQMCILLGIGQ